TLTPVTCGCEAGVVCPAAIVTVAGDTVTLEVSLLDKVTVTPPAGAGEDRLTANMVDCPSDATIPGARTTDPAACTVISAVALAMFGAAALAVMVALPGARHGHIDRGCGGCELYACRHCGCSRIARSKVYRQATGRRRAGQAQCQILGRRSRNRQRLR